MLTIRSPLVRLPLTLVLAGLLALSILFIKNIFTAAEQQDQRQEARYLHSPNCFPRQDPSEVDASLPPCQKVSLIVIAKSQNTIVDHYRLHDHSTTHRFLTLQERSGETQTVGGIGSDMWNSIKVGDQVSGTLWESKIQDVTANGHSSDIIDGRSWSRAVAAVLPWIVTGMICFCCLSLLWTSGRWGSGFGLFSPLDQGS